MTVVGSHFVCEGELELDGLPAEEYMNSAAPVFGDYSASMASHRCPIGL